MSRVGNRDRYSAPAQTFRARDGAWVYLVGGNDAHFPRLARMMRRPELLSDPRFATHEARLANQEAVEATVAEGVAAREADEVAAPPRDAELPGAQVATIADCGREPTMRR